MKNKFTYFLFALSLLFFFCASAQAKVYWVGRNIDISPSQDENKERTMMKSMGHSYLIIVPDNLAKLKRRYPEFAALERDLGCGRKGIVIGAYPNKGSEWLSNLDGNLEAVINAPREFVPTKVYFCGSNEEKAKWNFVGGLVQSRLNEEDFIIRLIQKTYYYIKNTVRNPVDYHAVRSTLDAMGDSNTHAQNCNSFAFSLLAYSGASQAPDIGAARVMPGNRHLLPEHLFMNGSYLRDADKDYTPELIKNDKHYKERVNKIKEMKSKIREINFSIYDSTLGITPF